MALPTVGAQLLVFGQKYNINTDTDAILDCVAKAGYKSVEGGAKDAALYRRKLDERGLVYAGLHTGLASLLDLKPQIAYLNTVGGRDWCISGLMRWNDRSLKDWQEGIALLNQAGKQLRAEGIHLHYHNHDFEFDQVAGAGKTGLDLLFDGLDFSACDLCVDVAWVYRGKADPAQFLVQHKERIGYLHFKDTDGVEWRELGTGKVDFASIMKVLPQVTKARWVMIEQDKTTLDPMDSATISRRYLKQTFNY
jgi:sugar phosphate isomerase/epimerase